MQRCTPTSEPMAAPVRRGLIATLVILTVLAAASFGLYVLWQAAQSHSDRRAVQGRRLLRRDGSGVVASTMVGVVIKRDLPERAAVLALAAGLQESKARQPALGEGDRDSVGVLQAAPVAGLGTEAQLQDIQYATGSSSTRWSKIDNWDTMALADAIQEVQVSVDGSYYRRHEGESPRPWLTP